VEVACSFKLVVECMLDVHQIEDCILVVVDLLDIDLVVDLAGIMEHT
jgi:hypothetical protein